ncbi:MAG: rod shape-determining protein RodA [bacterium]
MATDVRRWFRALDWGLLGLTLLLATCGVVLIYSATHAKASSYIQASYVRQLWWLLVGVVAMVAALMVDYRIIARYAYVLYGVGIAALVYVLVFGHVVAGAKRWLILGPVRCQPSEFMKVVLVLVLARYTADVQKGKALSLRQLALPALLVAVPVGLIANEPDLGTATMLGLVAGGLILLAGVERRAILIVAVTLLGAMPFGWTMLKGYQKSRLLTLLDPTGDPLGAGYHVIQSKIAVGSGMFLGKGLMQGTQGRLNFLPAQHTDFIFSVLAEELGFIGTVFLLALFLGFLLRSIEVAFQAKDRLGAMTAAGLTWMFALYITFNVGMTVGLLPVVGIPLPLVSYGGSSLVATMVSVGLLLNIKMRKFPY